jgi:hypothetical protein
MMLAPELAQLGKQGSRWRECCQMFGIDPKETGNDEEVKIYGIKTPLYQYQALGVYWAMLK